MKMLFETMEYQSKKNPGTWAQTPVSKVFLCAVMPYMRLNGGRQNGQGHGYDVELVGLNLGIVLPFPDPKESDAYEEFTANFYGEKLDDCHDVIVKGPGSGFKISVIVHTGNGWDPAYGSACLFGYLCPTHFDEMPLSKALGSLPMEYGN